MTTEVCEDSSSSFSSWWTGALMTAVAILMRVNVHIIFGLISCVCLRFSWGSVARRRSAAMLCRKGSTNTAWCHFQSSCSGNALNAGAFH